MADVQRRSKRLRKDVKNAVDKLDVFGLKPRPLLKFNSLTLNLESKQYEFDTDARKITSFNAWIKEQSDKRMLRVVDVAGQPISLESPYDKYIESAYKRGLVRGYTDSKIGLLLDHPEFYEASKEEFLRSAFTAGESFSKVQLLATRVFEDMQGFTSAVSQDANRILSEGLIRGDGALEISRALDKQINFRTKQRALAIARTETIRAHAEGQLDAFERLGVAQVGLMAEFLTAGDDRVCQVCQSLEGQVFTVEEARGIIPVHPNCRCAWIPFIK